MKCYIEKPAKLLQISHWRTLFLTSLQKKPLQQTAVSTSVQELENTSTSYWARPTLSQLFFNTKGIKMRDLFKTFISNECRGAKNGIKTSLTDLFTMACLKKRSETWYEVYCSQKYCFCRIKADMYSVCFRFFEPKLHH